MQEYRDMMTEIEKQGSLGPVLKQIETAVAGTSREIMEKGKTKRFFSWDAGIPILQGWLLRIIFWKRRTASASR